MLQFLGCFVRERWKELSWVAPDLGGECGGECAFELEQFLFDVETSAVPA